MKQWDVFISHASEDKETLALPLARLLEHAGLRVWIDRQELRLGDSLREKIDDGLADSSFGVVVLSKDFIQKGWPKRELNGLFALEEDGQKIILPIWHGITKAELAAYSPVLADRVAGDTSKGLKNVARDVIEVVLSSNKDTPSVLAPNTARLLSHLLEKNPPVEEIIHFLKMHPRVLTGPPFYFQSLVELSPVEGMNVPFAALDYSSTGDDYGITLIDFANISGQLLLDDGTLEADVKSAEHRVLSLIELSYSNRHAFLTLCNRGDGKTRFWLSAKIYARRRDSLTAAERRYFSRESREHDSSFDLDKRIEIRSYDRLTEQAKEWCSATRQDALANL